ncbi:methyltransferase domain-containing protein [Acidianus infernus]|uniref:Methyltransferase domain-containing protein n=1 Tax=Acidianus infernus TaxID=12915 RepID=A0A6A9QIN3_ACIIN|nr:class I SAM-dependent methyltransferase [Acidianus infernus]MUM65026.1 methyltransferase domain-containing protein [Acidianus infernus]
MKESKWKKIIETYDIIAPVYERGNKFVTLGNIERWRKATIKMLLQDCKGVNKVLDAGSGPGNMTKTLLKYKNVKVVLLDQSEIMIKEANLPADKVIGTFEYMPFRDNSFDAVIMGFSFHASSNMRMTIEELNRISRCIGIVSIGKPKNIIKKSLLYIYMKYFIPILSFLSTGPKYYKGYARIFDIYTSVPYNSEIGKIISTKFKIARFKEVGLGSVYIIIGFK